MRSLHLGRPSRIAVRVSVGALAVAIAVAGTTVAVTGAAQGGDGRSAALVPAPPPATGPPSAPARAASAPTPSVAPLAARITPDVLVTAAHALTPAELHQIENTGQARHAEVIDTARVRLGDGSTEAVGVAPSTFRAYTPAGTAESNPLWASVADGNVAVAHAVGKALGVPLGGVATVGVAQQRAERVGAYATTGLPGVGVLVDRALSGALGLVPRSGVILAGAGSDPVVTAALLTKALGVGYTVTALRVPTANGRLAWVAPAAGPISSPYGSRDDPLHPGRPEFHAGIDIAAPLGTPIYAAAAGVVQYAGPASGFGNEVILQHADGVSTVYGHMSTILVTSGPVAAGQPIAVVGSEGESTGPHLHFEVHVNDHTVDPLAWLAAHGVQVTR